MPGSLAQAVSTAIVERKPATGTVAALHLASAQTGKRTIIRWLGHPILGTNRRPTSFEFIDEFGIPIMDELLTLGYKVSGTTIRAGSWTASWIGALSWFSPQFDVDHSGDATDFLRTSRVIRHGVRSLVPAIIRPTSCLRRCRPPRSALG